MSLLNKIASMVNTGVIQFLNLVGLANRDYPMHDYILVSDGEDPYHYVVGKPNLDAGGDQKKLFVSKSTLMFATANTTIRLNSTSNVTQLILANTWYEFHSNVRAVYVLDVGTDGTIYIYCEGVLPKEARIGA